MPPPPASADGWEMPKRNSSSSTSGGVGDLWVHAPVPLPDHTQGRAGLPFIHTVANPMSVFLLAGGLAAHKLAAVARELCEEMRERIEATLMRRLRGLRGIAYHTPAACGVLLVVHDGRCVRVFFGV